MDTEQNEQVIYEGRPSWRSILGFYIIGLLVVAAAAARSPSLVSGRRARRRRRAAPSSSVLLIVGWLKRISTRYSITDRRLRIQRGIVARNVEEARVERVQNVTVSAGRPRADPQVGTVDFDTASNRADDTSSSAASRSPRRSRSSSTRPTRPTRRAAASAARRRHSALGSQAVERTRSSHSTAAATRSGPPTAKSASRRSRARCGTPARTPVVGDRVELDGERSSRSSRAEAASIERGGDDAPLAAERRRGLDRHRARPRHQPAPRRALPGAGRRRRASTRSSSSTRPTWTRTRRSSHALAQLRAVAPGVPVLPVERAHGRRASTRSQALLAPRQDGGAAGLLGRGQVDADEPAAGRRAPGDRARSARTTSAGRHTTTRRELIELPGGGALIDTPGLRAVPVTERRRSTPARVQRHRRRWPRGCRFGDCTHTAEPDCAVRAAVDAATSPPARLESYLALAAEAARERQTRGSERERAGRTDGPRDQTAVSRARPARPLRRLRRRPRGRPSPAASRSASALSVFSHVKSWSSRPKWP